MHWLYKSKQPLVFLVITTSAILLLILLIMKMRRNRKNISTTPNSSQLPAELTLALSHPCSPSTSTSSLSPTESASPRVPTPSLLEAPAKLGTPFPGRPASLSSGASLPPAWIEDPHSPTWLIRGLQNGLLQLVQVILGGLLYVLFPQRTATIFTLVALAICGSFGFPYALIAIRLWSKQWQFSLHNTAVTVIGQLTDHRTVRARPTHAVPYPQPKYYVRYRYTYNGTTYSYWLEVPQKYYKAWYDGRSIPIRCFSNQPARSYLPEYNHIRSTAAKYTFLAAFSLTALVLFVVAFMIPHFSEVVNGDNITPTSPPFNIFATAIPPTISLRPTVSCKQSLCTAQQIADEYCIELIDKEAASPSLYLTPVPSDNTPTDAIVSDCSHEQLYCPTSDTAYTNVFLTYYYKSTNTYDSAIILLDLQYSNTGWKISDDVVTNQYGPPLPGQECHT